MRCFRHQLAILAAILNMQISQINIFSGRRQAEIIMQTLDHAINTMDFRHENMVFLAYFGNFGSHIEYANELNLHIFMKNSGCDKYETLRAIQ